MDMTAKIDTDLVLKNIPTTADGMIEYDILSLEPRRIQYIDEDFVQYLDGLHENEEQSSIGFNVIVT
jgi:hypothetical protein